MWFLYIIVGGENLAIPQSNAGRIPPQAVEVEQAILGALILDGQAIGRVVEILQPADFYKAAHRQIYQAIQTLFEPFGYSGPTRSQPVARTQDDPRIDHPRNPQTIPS